jgi:hypothetical protein
MIKTTRSSRFGHLGAQAAPRQPPGSPTGSRAGSAPLPSRQADAWPDEAFLLTTIGTPLPGRCLAEW